MQLRVIDFDGAVTAQSRLMRRFTPSLLDFSKWGPYLRMTCGFRQFAEFQRQLAGAVDDQPSLSFLGSGDFHHVTLALLAQQPEPFNLLVIDKHPDWMRAIPVMHCGTWLWHALQLPNLKRVVHIGGDLDFDNLYRHLAPWHDLRSGRVTVLPAYRQFHSGSWPEVSHQPLLRPGSPSVAHTLDNALQTCEEDLARWPLYISLDKDAMSADESLVNWDSGTLGFHEVREILDWFQNAAGGNLAGMDVVGDWSPVRMRPGLRTLCHLVEHPRLKIDPDIATLMNERVNEVIADHVLSWSVRQPSLGLRVAA